MSRLEGSRWRLRWAREMRLAMEFEWVFFRLLFGAKRQRRRFQGCRKERQIPPHTWRIISRAASAAPAASLCAGHAQQLEGESPLADLHLCCVRPLWGYPNHPIAICCSGGFRFLI